MSQRSTLSESIIEIGYEKPDIFVLSPDTGPSTKASDFGREFPNRYVCTGIAEQNAIGLAAGLESFGWTPIIIGYAMFIGGKAWEPFHTSVCYPNLNVKMIATHAGLNVGKDGVSHQAIEDLAIMRAIPNITILIPRDENQVHELLRKACNIEGPVYMRLERESEIPIDGNSILQRRSNAEIMREGFDLTLIAIGSMVNRSLEAALKLEENDISARVINLFSLKPIDSNLILDCAKKTGAIVTAEDHSIVGGLGSAIAEVCGKGFPVPIEMVGINDAFAESGNKKDLFRKYKLDTDDIFDAAMRAIYRK